MKSNQRFEDDMQKEVAVVIAIQKTGIADKEEIKNKIEKMGGIITDKQIEKAVNNLKARGILSVDMTERKEGISVLRYKVKRVQFSVPEVAQIKNFIDSKDAQPLITELEKSKKGRKRSLSADYYKVDVEFEVMDKILGFMPDGNGVMAHYRMGKDIVLYPRHFRKWLVNNMRLVNKFPTVAERIQTNMGFIELNGKMEQEEFFITAVDSSFKSTGRGSKIHEAIPRGSIIKTFFLVPSDDFEPEQFQRVLKLICETPIRGLSGYSKSGFGHLKIKKCEIGDFIWRE